jgi:hypothetical protein
MAQEGLQIEIQANVQRAVQALKSLEGTVKSAGESFEGLGNKSVAILNSQLERLQRIASNPNLSTAQYEKLNSLINQTSLSARKLSQNIDFLKTTNTKFVAGQQQATFALTNFGRVAQDAPFGIIGIANNIDPLIQSFISLRATTTSTGAAFRALGASFLGPGGIIFAVSAITSALSFYALSQRGANKATKDAQKDTDDYVRSLSKQKEEFTALVNIARNAGLAEKDRVTALQRLNDIIPDTIGKLNLKNIAEQEGIEVINRYIKAVEAKATAELLSQRIAENNVKLFDNRNKVLSRSTEIESELTRLRAQFTIAQQQQVGGATALASIGKQIGELERERNRLQKEGRADAKAILDSQAAYREELQRVLVVANQLTKPTKEVRQETEKRAEAVILTSNAILRDTQELDKQRKILSELNSIIDLRNQKERVTGGVATTADLAGLREAGGGPSPLEQLDLLAGEFEKVKGKASELQGVIDNGINAGIDQFFNALANNQDPFAALQQSVKRLVAELAAAVIKTLILKAIANSIAPGSGELVGNAEQLSGRANRLIVNQLRVLG